MALLRGGRGQALLQEAARGIVTLKTGIPLDNLVPQTRDQSPGLFEGGASGEGVPGIALYLRVVRIQQRPDALGSRFEMRVASRKDGPLPDQGVWVIEARQDRVLGAGRVAGVAHGFEGGCAQHRAGVLQEGEPRVLEAGVRAQLAQGADCRGAHRLGLGFVLGESLDLVAEVQVPLWRVPVIVRIPRALLHRHDLCLLQGITAQECQGADQLRPNLYVGFDGEARQGDWRRCPIQVELLQCFYSGFPDARIGVVDPLTDAAIIGIIQGFGFQRFQGFYRAQDLRLVSRSCHSSPHCALRAAACSKKAKGRTAGGAAFRPVITAPRVRAAGGCRLSYFLPTKPRSMSVSAICTALVAAPLRMLSATTHMCSVFGTKGSSRTRPT